MPFPNDNDFPGRDRPSRQWNWHASSARWDALAAVLGGNALYFLLLGPRLPDPWHHQPFALDRGLGLDFLLCLALFGVLRLARRLV